MTHPLNPPGNRVPAQIILLAGLLVGTLDIAAASLDYFIATGKNPLAILNYVASGVFGKVAFSGGAGMALLGLLFHYLIAFSFTIFFFWLYPLIGFFSRNRVITGVVYGIFTWLIMNLVVVQLSNTPHPPISAMQPLKVIKSMLILIFMIGLPLSFIAYKYFRGRSSKVESHTPHS
jgi:hypothetical protein